MTEKRKKRNPKLRKIILNETPSPFYLVQEAAEYLRLERSTLDNFRRSLTGPRYRKHGGKVCYHERDLEAWSETQAKDMP